MNIFHCSNTIWIFIMFALWKFNIQSHYSIFNKIPYSKSFTCPSRNVYDPVVFSLLHHLPVCEVDVFFFNKVVKVLLLLLYISSSFHLFGVGPFLSVIHVGKHCVTCVRMQSGQCLISRTVTHAFRIRSRLGFVWAYVFTLHTEECEVCVCACVCVCGLWTLRRNEYK